MCVYLVVGRVYSRNRVATPITRAVSFVYPFICVHENFLSCEGIYVLVPPQCLTHHRCFYSWLSLSVLPSIKTISDNLGVSINSLSLQIVRCDPCVTHKNLLLFLDYRELEAIDICIKIRIIYHINRRKICLEIN